MLYLAYGSNMLSARLRERVPGARSVGAGRLRGWSLRFHKRSADGSGKCTIMSSREPEAIVHGAVFEMDRAGKELLDEAEVLGFGYRCEDVPVRIADAVLTASAYVAEESYVDDSLLPYDWYRDFVVAGAREHGLPEAYIREALAVEARPDPDTERDAKNRALLGTPIA